MGKLIIRRQKQISEEELRSVIKIKQQHWPYDIESQQCWIRKNLKDEDVHVMLFASTEKQEEHRLVAYLNLVELEIKMDSELYHFWGVGNVCVDKEYEHAGYGKMLMVEVNSFLKKNRTQGILLCKSRLIPFYKKCGWEVLGKKKVKVGDIPYEHEVMIPVEVIGQFDGVMTIDINRNF